MANDWQLELDQDTHGRNRLNIVRHFPGSKYPMRLARLHALVPEDVAAEVLALLMKRMEPLFNQRPR